MATRPIRDKCLEAQHRRRQSAHLWVERLAAVSMLVVFSGFLCFYRLGANDLHELDEAFHVQAAREMYHSGSFWHPTAFGHSYFNKPALPIWLTVASYHLFGTTVFAARFWAALFAVATVVVTYLLGERLGGSAVGFAAGFALATGYTFVYKHCARTCEFDSMMLFFFVLSMLLYHRAQASGKGWILCAAAAAMASHAKNFAGLAPAVIFITTFLLSRPAHRPGRRTLAISAGVFIGINLAWLVPMFVIHGWKFVDWYLGYQVLQRPERKYALPVLDVTLMHFRSLVAGFFPWALLGLAGLVEDGRKAMRERNAGSILVLLSSILAAILLCVVVRWGFEWYLLALLPLLAVSGARLLVGDDKRSGWTGGLRVQAGLAVAAEAVVFRMRPGENPFALWSSMTLPELTWITPLRAVLLVVAAGVAFAAGVVWSRRKKEHVLPKQRPIVWAVFGTLTLAGILAVIQPLGMANYQNCFARARQALRQAQGNRVAYLVTSKPEGKLGPLACYYFANLENFRKDYIPGNLGAALEKANSAPAPSFLMLISRDPKWMESAGASGKLILSCREPIRRDQPAPVEVAVIQVKSSE